MWQRRQAGRERQRDEVMDYLKVDFVGSDGATPFLSIPSDHRGAHKLCAVSMHERQGVTELGGEYA